MVNMRLNHRFTLLVLLSGLLSCGKIENSNSVDKFRFGETTIVGTPQFVAAATAIQKKCTFCHDHAHWKDFSEEQYLTTGLVAPQSLVDSPIFYRNANATSGRGPHNMPIGGNPAMTSVELDAVITWINSL